MKWIITFDEKDNNLDLNGALHDGGICWKQDNSFQVNDVVYIYESARTKQCIRYKCYVTAINKSYTVEHKSKYGGANVGETLSPGFEIQLEYEFVTPVTLNQLRKHGSGSKGIRVTKDSTHPEIFEYLEIYEAEDRVNGHPEEIREDDLYDLPGEEREALIKVRVNQGNFRQNLLKKYGRCCLCAVSDPGLLIASHIKPWADSNSDERGDSDNGLLLCPNHDRLFDRGYISFDNKGKILISDQLSETDRKLMNISDNIKIDMNGKTQSYMKYHRTKVFNSLHQ